MPSTSLWSSRIPDVLVNTASILGQFEWALEDKKQPENMWHEATFNRPTLGERAVNKANPAGKRAERERLKEERRKKRRARKGSGE